MVEMNCSSAVRVVVVLPVQHEEPRNCNCGRSNQNCDFGFVVIVGVRKGSTQFRAYKEMKFNADVICLWNHLLYQSKQRRHTPIFYLYEAKFLPFVCFYILRKLPFFIL